MEHWLDQAATRVTHWVGSTSAFVGAVVSCLIWAGVGPIYYYSDTWQLVANTGTTILTFLMLFLLQRSQNKDSLAIQVKLDELITALPQPRSDVAGIEQQTESEIAAHRRAHAPGA